MVYLSDTAAKHLLHATIMPWWKSNETLLSHGTDRKAAPLL